MIRATFFALGVAALAAAAWAGTRPADALKAGAPAPALLAGQGAPVTVAWVVGEQDWLTCRPPTRELRRVLARHPGRVQVVVVGVRVPPEQLRAFFHRERLEPRTVHLSAIEYRRHFGAAPTPGLYVVTQGRILAAMAGPTTGEAEAVRRRQEQVVAHAYAAAERDGHDGESGTTFNP